MRPMRRGFTVPELLIVIAIVVAIAVVGGLGLVGTRSKADLTSATQEAGALLRQAQANAMAQKNNTTWGVHFENATATAPFFALFSSTYASATQAGYYRLPASVAYLPATLGPGSSTEVTFSQVTGLASASTSIALYVPAQASLSSTISVASSGAVSY